MSFLGFFKYVLFIYNFVVMLFGASLLAVSTYFYVDTLKYGVNAKFWPLNSTFFILIIGIGLLTFIVGFFGCCGACKESSCMLCMYFSIIVVVCGLIAAIIFLPDKFDIKPQQIKSNLQQDIRDTIQQSYSRFNTLSFANKVIDKLQEDFQCCGAYNYTDWYNSVQNNSTRPDIGVGNSLSSFISENSFQQGPHPQKQIYYNPRNQNLIQSQVVPTTFRVPVSCCSKVNNEISYNQCKSMIARYDANSSDQQIQRIPNVNPDGCVEKIYSYLFVDNWWILNIIGGLAIGLHGLSLIFSFCLCCAINRAIDDYDDDEEK